MLSQIEKKDLEIRINNIETALREYAAMYGYSITLNRFVMPNIAHSGKFEVLLYFDVLIVSNGCGLFVAEFINLREFAITEVTKQGTRARLYPHQLEAQRVELNTNLADDFGDGFIGQLVLSLSLPYDNIY